MNPVPQKKKAIELVGIGLSPWTEKAQWVLDHHRVPYQYREHTILLGMPALSARLGLPSSEITVPLLIEGDQIILDSFDITQRVDARFGGSLIPAEHLPEIKHYNILCDLVSDASRALMIERLLKDPAAQAQMLPPFIPGMFRGPFRFMSRVGAAYIQQEFNTTRKSSYEYGMVMLQSFVGLSAAVERAGGKYLIGGGFTMADILGAVAVGGLRPHRRIAEKMGPAVLKCWTSEELEDRFGHLLEWRDWVYQQHR